MAALHQESTYNQRLALSAIEDRLDGLLRELTRSSERYAVRFRAIAASWRQIVADYGHDLAAAVELRQEIDSPYVIGVPLTEQQEIFVGRTDISARMSNACSISAACRCSSTASGGWKLRCSITWAGCYPLPSCSIVDLQGRSTSQRSRRISFIICARAMTAQPGSSEG